MKIIINRKISVNIEVRETMTIQEFFGIVQMVKTFEKQALEPEPEIQTEGLNSEYIGKTGYPIARINAQLQDSGLPKRQYRKPNQNRNQEWIDQYKKDWEQTTTKELAYMYGISTSTAYNTAIQLGMPRRNNYEQVAIALAKRKERQNREQKIIDEKDQKIDEGDKTQ